MRFPPALLDDIRARLPLSEVVGRRVTWDRRKTQPGRGDYWACCPFHQEKSPSFHVDDRRNHYKCFGCGASGDHFRFLMETEGLSFPEAVERLAESAGVALPKADPREAARAQKRAGLAEICEMAARFFETELKGPSARDARSYLERRKLTAETLNEFRFGYAPGSRDALKRHLADKGVDEAGMIEAGLLIKPEDGRPSYDRFRNRIIIPIQDERGRVVAFGGRTLDPDGQPKYLNSPETPLFHKGAMLFNVHRARQPAFEAKQAIVVEGYMDAIAVYQAGVRHVVAALGTAFTEDQIARMWRLAAEPIVCFDGDAAGVNAAHRAVDRILPALKSGFSFEFAFLPDGKDPDDLIQAGGKSAFVEVLENAKPLSDVVWQREVFGAEIDTPERKAAIEKRFDDLVGLIADGRVKRRYQQLIKLKLSNLFWQFDRKRSRETDKNLVLIQPPEGALSGIEQIILGICVHYPGLFEQNCESIISSNFSDEFNSFRDELYRILIAYEGVSASVFYNNISDEFYDTLNRVHGNATIVKVHGNLIEYKLDEGYELRKRFPILRYNPSEAYVEKCLLHFLDLLMIRDMENFIKDELSEVSADLDEAAEARLVACMQDLNRRREEVHRDEADLAEEAGQIRRAFGAGGQRASAGLLKVG